MYAKLKLDVAQGPDTDDDVRESLLDGLTYPDRVIARPTGEALAGGNPEWVFEGDARDLFHVMLNYAGIKGGDRDMLSVYAHSMEFDLSEDEDAGGADAATLAAASNELP